MSADEVNLLKAEVAQLRKDIVEKQNEIVRYRSEILKVTQVLDQLMSESQNDIQLLKQMYQALVPTDMPQFPGFEFSKKFVFGSKKGGDYFDIFNLKLKTKFGIILSSATSYAMSALLLSLILKHTSLLESDKSISAKDFIQLLADELKKSADEKDQAQILFAQIDRKSLSMTFCAVGNVLGFYQNTSGTIHRLSASEQQGLGQDFNLEITETYLPLEPKGRLVLVTEGILEVLTQDEIVTVMQRASATHDVRHELLFAAQRKSGLEIPLRDQTVVVMDIKDNIIKLAKA